MAVPLDAKVPPRVRCEERSFEEVYREGFRFVWRCLRRLGVPDSQVEDAVQDVFVVVHRRLDEFEGRASIHTWLFRITQRVASDYRRRRRRKPTEQLVVETVATERDGPAEQAQKRRQAEVLHAILESMDDNKRTVFILSELEQMRGPEIAEALGVPTDTVYSRLRAARSVFEKALARHRAREEGSA
ncbi:MAG: sigma-70 family RNA polymerase sigma factor [Myxococcota bacterium]